MMSPHLVESKELGFTAVDIFSGGGGLTVGLKRAGFQVVAAVEIEANAYATYKANHPEVQAFRQDIRNVKGEALKRLSPTGEISILAGCPPCQGFSSLTSKYKKSDARNDLVLEMARLVEETEPEAVMMENVPGLASKGKALFDGFIGRLEALGYQVVWNVLQVADFGVPQNRSRLVVLAGKGFSISLPQPTHSRTGANGLPLWRTLQDAIDWLQVEPVVLAETWEMGGPQVFDWHVVRSLSPENLQRLRATRPGKSRTTLPVELRPLCHRDRENGFSNVYGRMTWDQVPVTMTGGCTTLSKGRFGHPNEDRTISAREAALIQTFPMDYIFDTPYMEYVCNIIGNALPCDFAEILANQCISALALRNGLS
ncbi:MAG TPA: DNA cytosine methyltransferase [Chloroflexia bacterium]|nr:DNA cytosine methyltransferase [Chloroflexia bacterium]